MRLSRFFPTAGPVTPVLATLLAVFPVATWLYATPVLASEAVVVELYRDCRVADTTVVIEDSVLDPAQRAEIKARVAAAADDPATAVPKIIGILRNKGIDDIEITRQGFEGCEPDTSGKYVEAVGTYCGARLTRVELFVDRESVMSRDDPDMTLDAFLKQAVKDLRERGIYDRPLVHIQNAPDCEESS